VFSGGGRFVSNPSVKSVKSVVKTSLAARLRRVKLFAPFCGHSPLVPVRPRRASSVISNLGTVISLPQNRFTAPSLHSAVTHRDAAPAPESSSLPPRC
jgi:hypothetical protein